MAFLPSPLGSLETVQRHRTTLLPRALLPQPTTRPTSQARGFRITGCCRAVCRTSKVPTTARLSIQGKQAILPFLSVILTQRRGSPGLLATLSKSPCPKTETRRAIKAGVSEHRRSVSLPQLGGRARLAGRGPVLSL